MTDNEIIKEFEVEFYKIENALDLLNRQKAEIERLNAEAECADGYVAALEQRAKSEAIKEFAEKLIEKAYVNNYSDMVVNIASIDNLVKEMKEGKVR